MEGRSMEMTGSVEKREYPRVQTALTVRFRILGQEEAEKALSRHFDPDATLAEGFQEAETIDVSKNGLLMLANEEIRLKSFVAVSMYVSVPGISCNCKGLAEVVRRELNPESNIFKYKIGLRFSKVIHQNLKNYKFLDLRGMLDVKEPGIGSQGN
jgi:hypothetical protein